MRRPLLTLLGKYVYIFPVPALLRASSGFRFRAMRAGSGACGAGLPTEPALLDCFPRI